MTAHTSKIAAMLTAGTMLSRAAALHGLPAARGLLPQVVERLWLAYAPVLSRGQCESVAAAALEIVENELDLAAAEGPA